MILQWDSNGMSNPQGSRFQEVKASLSTLIAALQALTADEKQLSSGLTEILSLHARANRYLWSLETSVRAAQSLNVWDTGNQTAAGEVKLLADQLKAAFSPVVAYMQTHGNLTPSARLATDFESFLYQNQDFITQVLWPLRFLYNHLLGTMRLNVGSQSEAASSLSFPQVVTVLKTSDNPAQVEKVFRSLNSWLAANAQMFADILNSVAGYRLLRTQSSGETLINFAAKEERCSIESLEAMFDALSERQSDLVKALKVKTMRAGLDASGPIPISHLFTVAPNKGAKQLASLEDSLEGIRKAYGAMDAGFESFIDEALQKHWIETRNTSGRAAGAWCDNLPSENAVFIYLTNAPGIGACFQFAHLLGVGYLHHCCNHARSDNPMNRRLPWSLIEVAGMLCATSVERTMLKHPRTPEEEYACTIQTLKRLINMTLLLPMRHRLMRRILHERSKGILTVNQINRLSREAWQEVFGSSVDGCDQYIWAYKPHFYRVNVTYYDWQYTFGYLLSQLIWKMLSEKQIERPDFVRGFLTGMANMPCEDLMQKHLGIDIRSKQTWLKAIDAALEIPAIKG